MVALDSEKPVTPAFRKTERRVMPKFVEGYAVRIKVPDGHRDVLVLDSELPGFGIRKFASGVHRTL